MKKVLLLIFLIFSVIVSAKTWQIANSLSPPSQSLYATLKTQLPMLQVPLAETQQLDVCFFERDVFCSVLSESYQSVISRRLSVPCAVSSQVLTSQNSASVFLGKSNVLLQATSPMCRAVLVGFSKGISMLWFSTQTLNQALSPACRDVFSIAV